MSSLGDSTTKIEPNLTIPVRLDGNSAVELVYESAGDEFVTITARAIDEVDTVVELLNPDGYRVAYADNHHQLITESSLSPTDAIISGVWLDVVGTYIVRVDTFNGATTGDVDVTLQVIEPVPYTMLEEDDSRVVVGVQLPANRIFRYSFDVMEGNVYTITARSLSGLGDAVLTLHDSAGEIVADNDDHASNATNLNVFDARITDFVAERDGAYVVELRDFLGQAGEFELVVTFADGPADVP